MRFLVSVIGILLVAAGASAHPVPRDNHDRTIVVRLQPGDAPDRVRVRVEYQLEVDELTVHLNDMKEYRDEVNPLDFRGRPLDYYAEYARIYAPIFAERLVGRLNQSPIGEFRPVGKPTTRLQDEEGKNLGHLRCDFVFESDFALKAGRENSFVFREQNYLLEPGQVVLSFVNETNLPLTRITVPDDALRKRAVEQPAPGDDDRLREIAVVLGGSPSLTPAAPLEPTKAPTTTALGQQGHVDDSLWRLVMHNEYGLALTLLLAFLFGAAHALTPGHGKTLVAAYLVGERGTIWHACYLGLVTTLTHTGAVIGLALLCTLLSQDLQVLVQKGLGLVMGITVVCIGFWLLLQRLAGRADHVHLDGSHHVHGPERRLSWWGITLLGMVGGMVPCWDAIVLLIYSAGTGHTAIVLPVVLAFSAGLAVVLVVIGICVVQVPRFVESRFGHGHLVQSLPIVSALLVTLMGLWLCYEGIHGRGPHP